MPPRGRGAEIEADAEEIRKLSLGNAAAAGGDPVSLPPLPGEFGVDGEAGLVCMHESGHVDLQYWADTIHWVKIGAIKR